MSEEILRYLSTVCDELLLCVIWGGGYICLKDS
jgi:hypothetical protein